MNTSGLTGRLRHLWTRRRTFYFSTWHGKRRASRDGARQPRLTHGERDGRVPHEANGSGERYRQPPSWRAPYGMSKDSCEVVEVKSTEQTGASERTGGMRGPSGVLASGAGDLRTLKSFPTGSSCCQYDSTSPSHRRHLALLACRDQQKKLQCLGPRIPRRRSIGPLDDRRRQDHGYIGRRAHMLALLPARLTAFANMHAYQGGSRRGRVDDGGGTSVVRRTLEFICTVSDSE